jgi:hypothetical protein
MKLLIMQFPPISRHIIPLRSKYSPQHPVIKHPHILSLGNIYTEIFSSGLGLEARLTTLLCGNNIYIYIYLFIVARSKAAKTGCSLAKFSK